ncbi:Hypothetical predicted protein [Cloeon dipterum]|uniref:Uncharacterized protein n=1 Tax=Cloeon dipterum TaxID=197152 RepID=A0A8S1E4K2_9INSE|nr:Hypothetical predicted protein [Cloeon dipterum]
MRYSCKFDKYTTVPEELIIAKKAIYFTAFRTLCGSRTRLKKPDEENDMTAAKIERPDEQENQQHVTASVIGNAMRVNPKRQVSVAQFSKQVTLPIDSYSPISFALRKKLLGQCLMVTPLFHPHNDVGGMKNGSRQSLEVPVNDGLEKQRKGSAEATGKEAKKKFDEDQKETSMQDFEFE